MSGAIERAEEAEATVAALRAEVERYRARAVRAEWDAEKLRSERGQLADTARKWFVFGGATYYPSGDVVTADTPEQALELAELPEGDLVLVFPWDALALRRDAD